MAYHHFPAGYRRIAQGAQSWMGDTIRLALVRNYVFDVNDRTIADLIAGGGQIVTSNTLGTSGKDTNDQASGPAGVTLDYTLSCDYGNVAAGPAIAHELLYFYNVDNAAAYLLTLMDTADATVDGQPLTPDGGPVSTSWPSHKVIRFLMG